MKQFVLVIFSALILFACDSEAEKKETFVVVPAYNEELGLSKTVIEALSETELFH